MCDSGNKVGADGAKALVPALSEMKQLQSLNLYSKWEKRDAVGEAE
jgi:hypothetical protein